MKGFAGLVRMLLAAGGIALAILVLSAVASVGPAQRPDGVALAQEPAPTPPPTPASCGGWIAANTSVEATLPAHGAPCRYVFQGQAGWAVEITMEALSGSLDPVLTLIGPDGQVLATNDDQSPGDRNSLISAELLQDGQYTITAGDYGAAGGRFKLALRMFLPKPMPSTCGGAVEYGQQQEDSIESYQPRCDYTFQGEAGDLVTIRLEAVDAGLDPVLRLADASGAILAENDDADGRNSAISAFRLPEDGAYVAQAMAYQGQSTGRFLFVLEATSPIPTRVPTACGGTIQPGQVRREAIPARVPHQCTYTFAGLAGQVMTIRMDGVPDPAATSPALDPVVTLNAPRNSGEPPVSDDDTYGRNSLIWRYRLPVTGRYEIVASSYGASSGPFNLLLAEDGYQRGDRVQQVYSPAVNIRRTPGSLNKPAGDILGNVPVGALLDVVGGPQTANNLTWWQVQYRNAAGGQVTGWMAEARATGEPILAPTF